MTQQGETMSYIHIDERKWPDRRHWQFSGRRLGEDEHGVWLYVPSNTIVQRGDEAPRKIGAGLVLLVPDGPWWIVEYYFDHPKHSIYVNIGTPPAWEGDRVTQVDLDLDVVRNLDGTVEILDEDEFVDHQVRFEYPQDLTAGALTAAAAAAELLEQRVEPFGTAEVRWKKIARRHRGG